MTEQSEKKVKNIMDIPVKERGEILRRCLDKSDIVQLYRKRIREAAEKYKVVKGAVCVLNCKCHCGELAVFEHFGLNEWDYFDVGVVGPDDIRDVPAPMLIMVKRSSYEIIDHEGVRDTE